MAKKEISVEEHFLVPEHRILSDEEKAEIMVKYKAKEKSFPKISIKDPAIAKNLPKAGDLVEIKRPMVKGKSDYLYYRIVS
jgi:DNA-directed RNA polymerase subunit H